MTTEEHIIAEAPEAPDESPMIPDAFEVRDAASANWLVRRITEARRYADQVRAWAALEIRRAERDEAFFLCRYGGQLESWARDEIASLGGRRRSICLPGGTVGFRRERPHLLICDESGLLAWSRIHLLDALKMEIKATGVEADRLHRWSQTNCSEARIGESVSKSALDQYLRDTGECPPGTEIISNDKFFIK